MESLIEENSKLKVKVCELKQELEQNLKTRKSCIREFCAFLCRLAFVFVFLLSLYAIADSQKVDLGSLRECPAVSNNFLVDPVVLEIPSAILEDSVNLPWADVTKCPDAMECLNTNLIALKNMAETLSSRTSFTNDLLSNYTNIVNLVQEELETNTEKLIQLNLEARNAIDSIDSVQKETSDDVIGSILTSFPNSIRVFAFLLETVVNVSIALYFLYLFSPSQSRVLIFLTIFLWVGVAAGCIALELWSLAVLFATNALVEAGNWIRPYGKHKW